MSLQEISRNAGTLKTDCSNPSITYFGAAPVGYNTPAGWAAPVWIIWGVLADGSEVHPEGTVGIVSAANIWDNRAGYTYQ